jgi:hypothetical protein
MKTSEQVDVLMLAMEEAYGGAVRTPAGVSWLHAHHVPVRRLLTRVVKRLTAEAPVRDLTSNELVLVRAEPSLGYTTYHLSDAGVAYLLGRAAPEAQDEPSGRGSPQGASEQEPFTVVPTPVCAVSWTSRHAETLLPVLAELAARGITSSVLDLATDLRHAFPSPSPVGITVLRVPREFVTADGGPPADALGGTRSDRTVRIGSYQIPLHRLAGVAVQVLLRSSDSTQPSWNAAIGIERWFDRVLRRLCSSVLLCSNDTSPPGVLAVRAAERAGADTVYVQHGAWVEGQITWRASHCRHIAVMGVRDVVTVRTWSQRPDALVHVVGQPRFDVLADSDRAQHRLSLEEALSEQTGEVPPRIAVWACQPCREQKLRDHFALVAEGLRRAGCAWGLVIAPHPAQGADAFGPLLEAAGGLTVALADQAIGARGCLAGADALISASSTCGIEAVLLDVPVLELALPASRTLRLAEQRAAQRCSSSQEIAVALARVAEMPASVRVPATAKRAICHEGRSAAAVADTVSAALAEAGAGEMCSSHQLTDADECNFHGCSSQSRPGTTQGGTTR